MTGASWLGDPDRARHLADRMGRLAGRLRTVELDGDPSDERGARSTRAGHLGPARVRSWRFRADQRRDRATTARSGRSSTSSTPVPDPTCSTPPGGAGSSVIIIPRRGPRRGRRSSRPQASTANASRRASTGSSCRRCRTESPPATTQTIDGAGSIGWSPPARGRCATVRPRRRWSAGPAGARRSERRAGRRGAGRPPPRCPRRVRGGRP